MFGKKIKVNGSHGMREFGVDKALLAMARALDVMFVYDGPCAETYVKAIAPHPPQAETRYVPAFLDGEQRFVAAFTPEAAITAIVAALGLELRAEYVVGSADPQIVAVKAAAKRKR